LIWIDCTTQLPEIYFRFVLRASLQLGPRRGRMVLKLREKGWIVILRQVIPTSPLSLYGMERFRVRTFLVLFSRLGCTLNFPEVRNCFKIERIVIFKTWWLFTSWSKKQVWKIWLREVDGYWHHFCFSLFSSQIFCFVVGISVFL
jgi:hypothetical protein